MPRVPNVSFIGRRKMDGQTGKVLLVEVPELISPEQRGLDALQLADSHGRLDIRHVVFVARSDHLIMLVALLAETPVSIRVHAVKGKRTDLIGPDFVVCCDHPTFGGGQVFSYVKAKTG